MKNCHVSSQGTVPITEHQTEEHLYMILMVLHYELKLRTTNLSPVLSLVTHQHRTAANWRCQLIVLGLPKINRAGAEGFQIPAVIITSRAGRQVIIVS